MYENNNVCVITHYHSMTSYIIQSLITRNIFNVWETNFFLILSIGWKILTEKKCIKYSPQTFQSGIWIWEYIIKSNIIHVLNTRRNWTINRTIICPYALNEVKGLQKIQQSTLFRKIFYSIHIIIIIKYLLGHNQWE